MQITIDTKRDSPQDIRRAIDLLKRYLGSDDSGPTEVSEDSTDAFASMFGGETPTEKLQEEPEEKVEKIEIIPF